MPPGDVDTEYLDRLIKLAAAKELHRELLFSDQRHRVVITQGLASALEPASRQRLGLGDLVGLGPLTHELLVGVATATDQIDHGDACWSDGCLGEDAEFGGHVARAEAVDVVAVECDLAGLRSEQPRERPEQC